MNPYTGIIETRNELMDTAAFLFEGGQVVFILLLLLFVPGFALSLVLFSRLTDLRLIDRLVYSMVLSISSCIASVVIIHIVLGRGVTLETLTLVMSAFSLLVFLFWSAERYYLNTRLKKQEPKVSEDNQDLQKFSSRGINAKTDVFRTDTRTRVVYHENWKSGIHHTDHSYLMDTGEEIDIQQVSENKTDVYKTYIVEPPYQTTRYFEVVIREYNDDGVSQVDDLQIYPVLVTENPKESVHAHQPGSLKITKRIYQKTSIADVQWIYSHDFHIFAIIHAEDPLIQMVDQILEKLDKIVTSAKRGIQSSSFKEDRQILRNAFDTVLDNPHPNLSQTAKISGPAGFLPGIITKPIPEQTAFQPGVRPEDVTDKPEASLINVTNQLSRHQFTQPIQQKKRPESPEIQHRVLPPDIQKRMVLQTVTESKKVSLHTGGQHQVQVKDILKHPENQLVVDSIRKLQKEILRDLDMFNVTTESFKGSKKNIENIQIPKKADVNKKLSDAEAEMRDLDWLG